MTAAEAYAAAAAEGLTLLRSDNSTGFKHVAKQSDTLRKPYVAQPSHGGRQEYQGMFAKWRNAHGRRKKKRRLHFTVTARCFVTSFLRLTTMHPF